MGIEARLEQQSPERLVRLQEKAIEMAKYYFVGFGGRAVLNVGRYGSTHFKIPAEQNIIAEIYRRMEFVIDFYEKLPIDELKTKEEFSPLVKIKPLLPELRKLMDEVFKENISNNQQKLVKLADRVLKIGKKYRTTLIELLREIHQYPEAKDFGVTFRNGLSDIPLFFNGNYYS